MAPSIASSTTPATTSSTLLRTSRPSESRAATPTASRRAAVARLALLLFFAGVGTACSGEGPRRIATGTAPDSFRVAFETSKGPFVVEVDRAWAPHGADRFYELVANRFFDEQRFFRVLSGYIAQFGAHGDPKVSKLWEGRKIADDPRRETNARGTISFASDGPNSRIHQLFINLKDNPRLDPQGFVPIGRVVEGMEVVDALYDDSGEAPRYHMIATLGNSYLQRMFPKLDYIKSARVVGDSTRAR